MAFDMDSAPELLRRAAALLEDPARAQAQEGREELREKLLELAASLEKPLTTTEAAHFLGVSSPNTIKNWLEGGSFPGAFKTRGGHWRFPLKCLVDVKAEMEAVRLRNLTKELVLPVADKVGEEDFLLD